MSFRHTVVHPVVDSLRHQQQQLSSSSGPLALVAERGIHAPPSPLRNPVRTDEAEDDGAPMSPSSAGAGVSPSGPADMAEREDPPPPPRTPPPLKPSEAPSTASDPRVTDSPRSYIEDDDSDDRATTSSSSSSSPDSDEDGSELGEGKRDRVLVESSEGQQPPPAPSTLQELSSEAQAAERIPSREELQARHTLFDPVRQLVDKDAPPFSRASQKLRAPVQVALSATPEVIKLQETERKWLAKERAWLVRTMVGGSEGSQKEEEKFWSDMMDAKEEAAKQEAEGKGKGKKKKGRRARAKQKALDSKAVQWAVQQYEDFVESRPPDFLEPRNDKWFETSIEVSSVVDLKVKGQSLPDRLLKAANAGTAASGKVWDVATETVKKFALARMSGGSTGAGNLLKSWRDHHRQNTADSTTLGIWLSGLNDSQGNSIDLSAIDLRKVGTDDSRVGYPLSLQDSISSLDGLRSPEAYDPLKTSPARAPMKGKTKAADNIDVPAVILEGHEIGHEESDDDAIRGPSCIGSPSPTVSRLSLATSLSPSPQPSRAPSPTFFEREETCDSPTALEDNHFRHFQFPPRTRSPSPDPSTKSAPAVEHEEQSSPMTGKLLHIPSASAHATPASSPKGPKVTPLPAAMLEGRDDLPPASRPRQLFAAADEDKTHRPQTSKDEGTPKSGYSTPARALDSEIGSPVSSLASPIWRAARFGDDSVLTLDHSGENEKRSRGLNLRHHQRRHGGGSLRKHNRHHHSRSDDRHASKTSLLSEAKTAVTGRSIRNGPNRSMIELIPGVRPKRPELGRAKRSQIAAAEKEALAAAELADMLAQVATEDEQQKEMLETDKVYQRQAGLVLCGRTHFTAKLASVKWQTIKRIKQRQSRDWDAQYTADDAVPTLVESPYDITAFPLPTDDWRWVTDWAVDMRRDVDADGWEYFDCLTWRWRGDRMSLRNFSRRRAFIRTRAKAPLKLCTQSREDEEIDDEGDDFGQESTQRANGHAGDGGPDLKGLGIQETPSHSTRPSVDLKGFGFSAFRSLPIRKRELLGCDGEIDIRNPFFPLSRVKEAWNATREDRRAVEAGDESRSQSYAEPADAWKEALAEVNLHRLQRALRDVPTDREKLKLWRHYLLLPPLSSPTPDQTVHWPRPDPDDVWDVIERHLDGTLNLFVYARSRKYFMGLLVSHAKSHHKHRVPSGADLPVALLPMRSSPSLSTTENGSRTPIMSSLLTRSPISMDQGPAPNESPRLGYWGQLAPFLTRYHWPTGTEGDPADGKAGPSSQVQKLARQSVEARKFLNSIETGAGSATHRHHHTSDRSQRASSRVDGDLGKAIDFAVNRVSKPQNSDPNSSPQQSRRHAYGASLEVPTASFGGNREGRKP